MKKVAPITELDKEITMKPADSSNLPMINQQPVDRNRLLDI